MNRIAYIAWLAGQALSVLTMLWPVTLTLFIVLGIAVYKDASRRRLSLGPRLAILLLPAVGILLMLVLGSLLERQPSLFFLGHVAFGITVLLAVASVVVLRPAWLTSIAGSLCFLWAGFWCWFVCVMSITGDWI